MNQNKEELLRLVDLSDMNKMIPRPLDSLERLSVAAAATAAAAAHAITRADLEMEIFPSL